MKRPGTRQTYERLLDRIRQRVPGVALRTTFIVGFPGETDADVDEMVDFVQAQAFEHVGVFTYSHEEGTSAWALEDGVPGAVKTARRNRVMSAQKRVVRRRQRDRVGGRARLIVDGPGGHEWVLKGRLASQAPDIDASVYLTDCDPTAYAAGDLLEVELVGARDYDLIARPVV
jgi:ribosomal protein S12 methylthiotransferase